MLFEHICKVISLFLWLCLHYFVFVVMFSVVVVFVVLWSHFFEECGHVLCVERIFCALQVGLHSLIDVLHILFLLCVFVMCVYVCTCVSPNETFSTKHPSSQSYSLTLSRALAFSFTAHCPWKTSLIKPPNPATTSSHKLAVSGSSSLMLLLCFNLLSSPIKSSVQDKQSLL